MSERLEAAANAAVDEAFKLGRYVDRAGQEWRKGLDGWFFDHGEAIWLVHHLDMASKIKEEAQL
jgi:hypothetical protein